MEFYTAVFGTTKTGETVTAYTLQNNHGMKVVLLDYGCTIQSLFVPNRQGGVTDVVLGYDTIEAYEENDGYLGAAIGRVGNRIGKGTFTLAGKTYNIAVNNGPNHLHGGLKGFDKFIWEGTIEQNVLTFRRTSKDGEESYPGTLDISVSYILTEENALEITYTATSDKDTLVNLTNHSYFNLAGEGSVLAHDLQVFADTFLENDAHCLPTGAILTVENTPFDFRTPKPIGRDLNQDHIQLKNAGGYDHTFCLSPKEACPVIAHLQSDVTGIGMEVATSLPGVQVYSSNFLTPRLGKNNVAMTFRSGLCLETQGYPDAINNSHFPSVVVKANEDYYAKTVFRFQVAK